jgi:hypothetical protein
MEPTTSVITDQLTRALGEAVNPCRARDREDRAHGRRQSADGGYPRANNGRRPTVARGACQVVRSHDPTGSQTRVGFSPIRRMGRGRLRRCSLMASWWHIRQDDVYVILVNE